MPPGADLIAATRLLARVLHAGISQVGIGRRSRCIGRAALGQQFVLVQRDQGRPRFEHPPSMPAMNLTRPGSCAASVTSFERYHAAAEYHGRDVSEDSLTTKIRHTRDPVDAGCEADTESGDDCRCGDQCLLFEPVSATGDGNPARRRRIPWPGEWRYPLSAGLQSAAFLTVDPRQFWISSSKARNGFARPRRECQPLPTL